MFTATVNGTLSGLGLDPRGTAPFPRSTAPMLMHKASRLVSSPDWTNLAFSTASTKRLVRVLDAAVPPAQPAIQQPQMAPQQNQDPPDWDPAP